jgi:formamidopyrimidine-DNA glycosylase
MPELPEVETVVRDLRPRIVGAEIRAARSSWPRTLRTHQAAEFEAAIRGHTIVSIGRRAKLLVVHLSDGLALTIHLKMTGQLFVVPAGTPEDSYLRLVLVFADGRELRFRDIRKFGRVGLYELDPTTGELVSEPGGTAVLGGFGPEPLDPGFDLARFRRRIRARKSRLKPLLLDQSFIAGIGNIYADEALWTARLHPLRSAATLRPADERRLYLAIRLILAEAIERRGSSIDDYTAPDGDGQMQERLNVYQRTGEPCPRCGRPIRRIVIGARATHFCSWCQRLPVADRRSLERSGGIRILRAMSAGDGRDEAGRIARTRRTRAAAATRRASARSSTGRVPAGPGS